MTNSKLSLPPGQTLRDGFPRFGLSHFANRFPRKPDVLSLKITGLVNKGFELSELDQLSRVEQISDFHCVTTWSQQSLHWSGYCFSEFYDRLIKPRLNGAQTESIKVIMRGQDGYRSALLLEDMLASGVLLADQLNHQSLGLEHGAPLRLVAPAHYGYKNVKHLSQLEFVSVDTQYPTAALKIMDHPRARVALEERGLGLPGWVYRYLYRPLVKPTTKKFAAALKAKQER